MWREIVVALGFGSTAGFGTNEDGAADLRSPMTGCGGGGVEAGLLLLTIL